jgi:hypothetical protein
MPIPLYILCAESSAIDAQRNSLSVFNVIEQIQLVKIEEGAQALPPGARPVPTVRIIAVWGREENDVNQMFEGQIVIRILPGQQEMVIGHIPPFSFPTSVGRLIGNDAALPPTFHGPGWLQIECRLHRVGQEEWISQRCSIRIEEASPPFAPGLQPTIQTNGSSQGT